MRKSATLGPRSDVQLSLFQPYVRLGSSFAVLEVDGRMVPADLAIDVAQKRNSDERRDMTGRMFNSPDVVWLSSGGQEMTPDEWNSGWIKCFGVMLDGRTRKTAVARHGEDDSVLIIMNSSDGEVDFKLPQTSAGPKWTLLLDTNVADGATATPFAFDSVYKVAGRSFALFTSADAV